MSIKNLCNTCRKESRNCVNKNNCNIHQILFKDDNYKNWTTCQKFKKD